MIASGRRTSSYLIAGLVFLAAAQPLVATSAAVQTHATGAALAALRGDTIAEAAPARRVYYTWTTPDQITELRQNPRLLSRAESPEHGAAYFDTIMAERAAAGDAIAQLLRQPDFRRARFAWANPWATLLGGDAESYGDQLLRVTLRQEAWIAVYSTKTRTFRFVDLHNRRVARKDVLQTPQRLAAVYYVNDLPRGGTYQTYGKQVKAVYREYVLCNESMIVSWEAGSSAVHDTLQRALTAITALRRTLPGKPPVPARTWMLAQPSRWHETAPPSTALAAYERALAFPNPRYYPSGGQLAALIQALQQALTSQPAELHSP